MFVYIARAQRLATSAFLAALATACGTEASAQQSLIGSLVATRPVIACMDNVGTTEEGVNCAAALGIDESYRPPRRRESSEDFTRLAVVNWFGMTGGATESISDQQFQAVIDYSSCIERETYTLQGIEVLGDPKNAIGTAYTKVIAACDDNPMSPASFVRRYPSLLTGEGPGINEAEISSYYLAQSFGSAAFQFVIEANGWVSDEMRPCTHFIGDPTPQPGCPARGAGRAQVPRPPQVNSND